MRRPWRSLIRYRAIVGQGTAHDKGVALILVLLVLALLMVIVLEFSFAMRVEVSAARNFNDEVKCYFFAQTGFQQAVAELVKQVTFRQAEDEEVTTWRDDQRNISITLADGGAADVMISNERGKYDVNTIPEDLLRSFVASLGVTEVQRDIITDSILDWRDDDTFHRLNGAEDDYYESLPHPYACKDGPFETIEELLLVRGVTPSLFYGTSAGEDDTGEAFSLQKGLADLVTVYSRSNRVEVNSAPKEVLMTIPGINEEVATKIIEARKERPLKDLNAIRAALGDAAYAQALQYLAFGSSPVYSIVATGIMRESGIKRRIKGIVRINLRSAEKYQVVYWADNYPMGGNMIPVSRNPWEKGDEEFS